MSLALGSKHSQLHWDQGSQQRGAQLAWPARILGEACKALSLCGRGTAFSALQAHLSPAFEIRPHFVEESKNLTAFLH
jgi:hypothetical protein